MPTEETNVSTKGGVLLKSALKIFDTAIKKLQKVAKIEEQTCIDIDNKVDDLSRERINHQEILKQANRVLNNITKIIS